MPLMGKGRQSNGLQPLWVCSSCPSDCPGDADVTVLVETTGTEHSAKKASVTCERATLDVAGSELLDKSTATEDCELAAAPSEHVDVIVSFLSGNSTMIAAELAWTGLQLSREVEKVLPPGKAVQGLIHGDQVVSNKASLGSGAVVPGEQLLLSAVIGSLEDLDLKSKGYPAIDLKIRGYTAAQLCTAGYSKEELRQANYSAKELRAAGCSLSQLTQAGYSAKELRTAGYSAKELRRTFAWSPNALHSAGYPLVELFQCGYSLRQHQQIGCLAEERLASGFMLLQREAGQGAIAH